MSPGDESADGGRGSARSFRSLLYVPASRPRMLAKIPQLPADAFIVDLEDGVAPAEKARSRENLRMAQAARGGFGGSTAWMLRVNAVDTPWFDEDLDLAWELAAPRVVLAKAERVAEVEGVCERCVPGTRIALMLETARGIGCARELAAHPSVDLLILGSADLRRSIGARDDRERDWERHALGETLLAARMHGCAAVDGVYFRFRDAPGLERHARFACDLGFDGKSCIHPDQLATVHAVYTSTADEIAWARSVLKVWESEQGPRVGVVVLEGEMLEALHVDLARRILARRPESQGEVSP